MTSALQGLDDLKRNMAAAAVALRKATEGAIYLEGNNILADSVERTPLDLGPLRASAYVTHPTKESGTAVVEIGYGGPAASYAVVQHEREDFHHEVGEAKFLEKALDAARSGYVDRVAALAADLLESGSGTPRGEFPSSPNSGAAQRASTRAGKQRMQRQKAGHRKANRAEAKRRRQSVKRTSTTLKRSSRWSRGR